MALTHAQPGEVVDLRPLGPALAEAKTTALVKSKLWMTSQRKARWISGGAYLRAFRGAAWPIPLLSCARSWPAFALALSVPGWIAQRLIAKSNRPLTMLTFLN